MLLQDVLDKLGAIRSTCDNATQACVALQTQLLAEIPAIDPIATMQQINSLQQQVADLQAVAQPAPVVPAPGG